MLGEERIGLTINPRSMAEDRKYRQQQREIMAEMANNNPQFLQLLEARLKLKKAYETEVGARPKELVIENRYDANVHVKYEGIK